MRDYIDPGTAPCVSEGPNGQTRRKAVTQSLGSTASYFEARIARLPKTGSLVFNRYRAPLETGVQVLVCHHG